MLDEIDKLGRGYRGDAAPTRRFSIRPNNTFRDNHLDLLFDLSGVLFITTANDQHARPWATDRLEICGSPVLRREGRNARRYLSA